MPTFGIPTGAPSPGNPLYGDGSDGSVTISGTVGLSRNMTYDNLVIPAGATLNTNCYRVRVRNTLYLDGILANLGVNFGNYFYSAKQSGGAGTSTVGGGGAGNTSGILLGGPGGAGGDGPGGIGGGGGPFGTPAALADGPLMNGRDNMARAILDMYHGRRMDTPGTKYLGGSGGGGAGGSGTQSGGNGGDGGGIVVVFANNIVGSGIIHADGGAGQSPVFANAGGGGGGGGGVVAVFCTYASPGLILRANGGAGGTPQGTGTAGTAGSPGCYAITVSKV